MATVVAFGVAGIAGQQTTAVGHAQAEDRIDAAAIDTGDVGQLADPGIAEADDQPIGGEIADFAHAVAAQPPYPLALFGAEGVGQAGDEFFAPGFTASDAAPQARRPHLDGGGRRRHHLDLDTTLTTLPRQIVEAGVAVGEILLADAVHQPVAGIGMRQVVQRMGDRGVRRNLGAHAFQPFEIDLPDLLGKTRLQGQRGAGNPAIAVGDDDHHLVHIGARREEVDRSEMRTMRRLEGARKERDGLRLASAHQRNESCRRTGPVGLIGMPRLPW